MLNYYDELKNDIMEVLEDEYSREYEFLQENKDLPKDTIFENLLDYLIENDSINGNISGSYYCNAYKARKQCYNYFRDVFEALEDGYEKELQQFKTFVAFVEDGYLNIENMTLNYDYIELLENEDEIECCKYYFEEYINSLDFEALDVITRCYKMNEVLWDVLDNYLD